VFACVIDHASNDVGDVLVGQRVSVLTPDSGGVDQSSASERLEMLRDGRLREPEKFDELVDTAVAVGELMKDLQPPGVRERLEQFRTLSVGQACFRCHRRILTFIYSNNTI
jgi:hypothetical protein